jgi:SMI1 / KNR4 family (SUKH-1)
MSFVWTVESMRPLVLEWDAAIRAHVPAYARLVPAAEARGSVLRPPATPEEIVAAENELGVSLPASYRSFLLIANGADAGPTRANHCQRLREPVELEILGVDGLLEWSKTARLRDLIDICRETGNDHPDLQEVPSADEAVDVHDFSPGYRGLLITAPDQDATVALVPFPGEWQTWEFFTGEVYACQSFAALLATSARRPPMGDRPRRARSHRRLRRTRR